jgi:hypothetical protein
MEVTVISVRTTKVPHLKMAAAWKPSLLGVVKSPKLAQHSRSYPFFPRA